MSVCLSAIAPRERFCESCTIGFTGGVRGHCLAFVISWKGRRAVSRGRARGPGPGMDPGCSFVCWGSVHQMGSVCSSELGALGPPVWRGGGASDWKGWVLRVSASGHPRMEPASVLDQGGARRRPGPALQTFTRTAFICS